MKLGSQLAVKFLDARFVGSRSFVVRFEREAQAAAAIEALTSCTCRTSGSRRGLLIW
ncbi:MAG: hypothetical protein R3B70_44335 [Polyangiaceae bacterium]